MRVMMMKKVERGLVWVDIASWRRRNGDEDTGHCFASDVQL